MGLSVDWVLLSGLSIYNFGSRYRAAHVTRLIKKQVMCRTRYSTAGVARNSVFDKGDPTLSKYPMTAYWMRTTLGQRTGGYICNYFVRDS